MTTDKSKANKGPRVTYCKDNFPWDKWGTPKTVAETFTSSMVENKPKFHMLTAIDGHDHFQIKYGPLTGLKSSQFIKKVQRSGATDIYATFDLYDPWPIAEELEVDNQKEPKEPKERKEVEGDHHVQFLEKLRNQLFESIMKNPPIRDAFLAHTDKKKKYENCVKKGKPFELTYDMIGPFVSRDTKFDPNFPNDPTKKIIDLEQSPKFKTKFWLSAFGKPYEANNGNIVIGQQMVFTKIYDCRKQGVSRLITTARDLNQFLYEAGDQRAGKKKMATMLSNPSFGCSLYLDGKMFSPIFKLFSVDILIVYENEMLRGKSESDQTLIDKNRALIASRYPSLTPISDMSQLEIEENESGGLEPDETKTEIKKEYSKGDVGQTNGGKPVPTIAEPRQKVPTTTVYLYHPGEGPDKNINKQPSPQEPPPKEITPPDLEDIDGNELPLFDDSQSNAGQIGKNKESSPPPPTENKRKNNNQSNDGPKTKRHKVTHHVKG